MKRSNNKLEGVDANVLQNLLNKIGWSGLLVLGCLTLFTVNRPVPAIQGAESRSFAYGTKVEDFESISGSLNGKNGWTASSGVTVVSDPDPNYGGNQVMRLDGGNRYASKALPEIEASDENSHIFFRIYRSGGIDGYAGGSDDSSPSAFDDFEAQVGAFQGGAQFTARDGSAFSEGRNRAFDANSWHCVWIYGNHDNGGGGYEVRIKGGEHEFNISLGIFDFRNGTADALTSFLARTGSDEGGDLYIDDIYIDKNRGYFADDWDQPAPGCPESEQNIGSGNDTYFQVDNFESSTLGAINGQPGPSIFSWRSNGADVIADPAESGNQILSMDEDNLYASLSFDEEFIPLGNPLKSGVLFYRFYRDGTVNGFGGTTIAGSGAPDWGDFVTQFGAQPNTTGDFTIVDRTTFRQSDQSFENRVWYCVWHQVYDQDLSYRVYIEGGDFTQPTLIDSGNIDLFDYRNQASDSIRSFLARSGPSNSGALYFDDIYQASGSNTTVPSGVSSADCGRRGSQPVPTATPTATTEAQPPQSGWQTVDTFETLNDGSLGSQNGWASSGVSVVDDPDGTNNSVIALNGDDRRASKSFPAEIPEENSSLFFRMRRDGSINGFGGAAESGNPTQFSDFKTQVGAQPETPADFKIRNAGDFETAPNLFRDDTWYCVWLDMNTSRAQYQVYLQGGQFENRTRIDAEGFDTYDFRSGGDLNTFFTLTGPDGAGTLYLDDIYLDVVGNNQTIAGGNCQAIDPEPTNTPLPGTPTPTATSPAPTSVPPTPTQTPVKEWLAIDTFESQNTGPLNFQNGWNASGVDVTTDPDNGNDQVIALQGEGLSAYKSFPYPIQSDATGTLFFRMRRDGAVNGFGGTSDTNNPSTWSDYETQFGAQPYDPADFKVRDGNAFHTVQDSFQDDTWYCVWLVNRNSLDRYNVYLYGGQYDEVTLLTPDRDFDFEFRNGGSSPLTTFFAFTGPDGSGTLYMDDIYVNPGGDDFSQPGGNCPTDQTPTVTPTPVPAGWQPVDDFNGLRAGNIDGRNGWTATGGIAVGSDPENGQNQILQVNGAEVRGYKPLPNEIQFDTAGTLFFRMRRSGTIDAFGGLSNDAAPVAWSDYETQFGGQSATPGDFRIRSEDRFNGVDNGFRDDTWYCVWMVPDLRSAYYFMYVQGGQYSDITGLQDSDTQFHFFRNDDFSPLTTFFTRSGYDVGGTLMFDDIYIDPAQDNRSYPIAADLCDTETTPPPPADWSEVDQFEALTLGPLNGQGGWSASPSFEVSTDPESGSNQVLMAAGDEAYANSSLAEIANSDTGTLFYRIYREGTVNGFGGLSDVTNPTEFNDYEVQFGAQDTAPGAYRVRNGGGFLGTPDTFKSNQWYCVWLLADNANDQTSIFVQGGQYSEPTRFYAGGQGSFDFRSGGDNPLNRFFARTGPRHSGQLYFDDIFVHTTLGTTAAPELAGECPHTRTNPQPDAADLTVDRIEIGQTLMTQRDPTTNDFIPLIEEKVTLVRVYLELENSVAEENVGARLFIRDRNGQVYTVEETLGPRTQTVREGETPDPGNLDASLNFLPDPRWLSGDVQIWAEVDPANTVNESNEENNLSPERDYFFQLGQDFRVAWIEMPYRDVRMTTSELSDVNQADRTLLNMLPLGANDLTYFEQPGFNVVFDEAYNENGVNNTSEYMNALRTFWDRMTLEGRWVGNRPPHRLYGWVPGSYSSRWGGQADVSWPGYNGSGRVAVGKVSAGADTFAHEIGHLLDTVGLRHTPHQASPVPPGCGSQPGVPNENHPTYAGYPLGSIGVLGFDADTNGLLDPNSNFDFMSYCRPRWISPYNYALTANGFEVYETGQRQSQYRFQMPMRNLIVSGIIQRADNGVTFDPFYELVSTVPTEPTSGTDYCLSMRAADDSILEERCFNVSFEHSEAIAPLDEAGFSLTMPYPGDTARVVLSYAGDEIAARVVSPNKPEVTLLSPTGQSGLTGNETISVQWTASDPDGDSLAATLSYSTDEGESWIPLGSHISANSVELDLSRMPGSNTGMIRVGVSDGVNTTFVYSEMLNFNSSNKPPQAQITMEETTFVYGQAIILQGFGTDLEDGTLADEALTWYSSLDGDLGSGRWNSVPLSMGTHEITLTVVDSNGATSETTIRIKVGDEAVAPSGDRVIFLPWVAR